MNDTLAHASITTQQREKENLARVLNPRTIALVGATARAGSFGARTIENLAAFDGELFLVNPRYQHIDGVPCYAAIKDIETKIDSAIIALPGPLVHDVLLQCSQAGVGGAVVYASGFAELGDGLGIERQEHLSSLAKDTGMRIVGPNCMGVVNYNSGAIQSFQQFPHEHYNNGRAIALVCQSGALSLALSQAAARGLSFTHILTFGNGADVDLSDLIGYLATEPECHAIACVFEGLAEPAKLIQAAALARQANKPLIIYKLATSEKGAQAALSHTGALAGSEALYRSFLEKEQVIWVERFDALLEVASFFAKAPTCQATGVGVVAASGGAGIMAVDKAEEFALDLPQPHKETQDILARNIPVFGSANNPCDVTAEVVNQPDSLLNCLLAMGEDNNYGALIVAHTVAGEAFNHRAAIYAQVAKQTNKPVCTVWLSEWRDGPGAILFENDAYIAVFSTMDNCMLALERWQWRAKQQQIEKTDKQSKPTQNNLSKEQIKVLQNAQGKALAEDEAKALLSSYGLQAPQEKRVHNLDEALKAAEAIGFPVVLKVLSNEALHKTELGGVQLNIQDAQQLEQSWHNMVAQLKEKAPQLPIAGFSIQAMAAEGIEILIGAKNDPQFGAFLMFGFGGVLVELIKDTVVTPVPISPKRARYLLGTLKNKTIFNGIRGGAAVDLDALAEVISNISIFVGQHAQHFTEMDINPLICRDDNIIAVDALIVC